MSEPTRADAERLRVRHAVERLKAMLGASIEMAIAEGHASAEVGQSIALTAVDIAMRLARLEAYTLAEQDTAKERGR